MDFPSTPLYVICDHDSCARAGWAVADFADACLQGGARLVQLRAKRLSTQAFLDVAMAVVERARPAGAAVIVNDRADVALASRAAGVHVGQDDLSPAQVRIACGEMMLVGLSTHTPQQAAGALSMAIDYLAVGPVFGTTTKETGYEAVGLAGVRLAATRTSPAHLPLVAIGGITLQRAPEVIASGAQAVCVIGDLLTGDPTTRVREYLRQLA